MKDNSLSNVLFLGNLDTHPALLAFLKTEAMEFTALENWPSAGEEFKPAQFDIVFLDSAIGGLEDICSRISSLTGAPVILLLNEREPEWQRLFRLPVDGFLKEDTGRIELLARIRSIFQRKTKILQKV